MTKRYQRSNENPFTDSHYSFGIFWSLCCMSFFDLRILITPLVSFGHYAVCPSSIYGLRLIIVHLMCEPLVSNIRLIYRITSMLEESKLISVSVPGDRRGHDRMIVGYTTAYAISAYHH
jgi:hypothetical protein